MYISAEIFLLKDIKELLMLGRFNIEGMNGFYIILKWILLFMNGLVVFFMSQIVFILTEVIV